MKTNSFALMFAVFGLSASVQASSGRYMELDEFLLGAFGAERPTSSAMVVDAELRSDIEDILGHRFSRIRVRYWQTGDTTAWVFDEIGKTEPITIGVSVHDGQVASVRILEFRESRGWEVRYPFFTDQFDGAQLDPDGYLSRAVDGITGATLSVTAVQKIVRVALFLNDRAEDDVASKRPATRS